MTINLTRREWLAGSATVAGSLLLPGQATNAQTFLEPNLRPTAKNPIRAHYNENAYGQSPKAVKAMKNAFDNSHNYAYSVWPLLIDTLAEMENIDPDFVSIAAGSTEYLEKAAIFNKVAGGTLLTPSPTYGDIVRFAQKMKSDVIEVPVGEDMNIDLDAMRAAMTDEVKLIYICNPNNPVPSIIEKNALRNYCIEMSKKALILIDEAYYEYVDNPDFESMVSLVREGHKNIMVTRTASKIHAFAGIRIGACFSHPDTINEISAIFANTLNYTAIIGAATSYRDMDYQNFLKSKNRECLKIINDMCNELDLRYIKSNANFAFFDAGRPSKEVAATMKKHHFLTGREFKPFTNWVRLTMTKPEEMRYFVELYKKEYS